MSRTPGRSTDLAHLSVAITGGARGIGAATARALRDLGARVVVGDRDADALVRTAEALGVRSHPLDVTSRAGWEQFAEFATASGPVDVLVNNAGIMPVGPLLAENDEVTRQIFEVNTFGVIHGTKVFAPAMVGRGSGHVVNIASAVGRVALAGGATYSASKHAVVGFTEALREELEPHGVRVSMVLPAVVDTALAAGVGRTRGVPMATPDQVAGVIVDVLRDPVPEVWVPRWGQPLAKVAQAMPRVVQRRMSRALRADSVLSSADLSARSAYEQEAVRTP